MPIPLLSLGECRMNCLSMYSNVCLDYSELDENKRYISIYIKKINYDGFTLYCFPLFELKKLK